MLRKIKNDTDRQQLQDDLNKLTEWSERYTRKSTKKSNQNDTKTQEY